MRRLDEVTLCAVDTRQPALALAALRRCMAALRFARVLLFTDRRRLVTPAPDVELVDLDIDSVAAYSHFMLRGLAAHVHSAHLLIVQWDGFVLHPEVWDEDFLRHDYIGAPWPGIAGERAVGNGGFSLRSRRLLQALQDPALAPSHPEDLCICHQHREALQSRHGIRFAPRALAGRFAFEREAPVGPTFGFHGLFNFDRALPAAELRALLPTLPDAMLGGLDAHDLCARLIAQQRLDEAALIVAARRRLGMHDRRSWRLRTRLTWARLRARAAAARPGLRSGA